MRTKETKKKIGIIGGVGPQATRTLYDQIITLSQSLYGAKNNDDFPNVLIESVPIPDFISDTEKLDEARAMLMKSVKNLEAGGATILAIGSNTVHLLLEDLQKQTSIKFLSIIDLVTQECKNRKLSKVGILASPNTLNLKLYDKKLENAGIKVLKPKGKYTSDIENMIHYYIAGKSNGEYKTEYIEVLNRLFERGAEAVILGCTELPLVVNYEALGNRVIDSSEILARALVEYYFN